MRALGWLSGAFYCEPLRTGTEAPPPRPWLQARCRERDTECLASSSLISEAGLSHWHSCSFCCSWSWARSWQDRRVHGVDSFPPLVSPPPSIYLVNLPFLLICVRSQVQTHRRSRGTLTQASATHKSNLQETSPLQAMGSQRRAALTVGHKSLLITTFLLLLPSS